jgi:hypothetical protein
MLGDKRKCYDTIRYDTVEVENRLKGRSECPCFLSSRAKLMTSTQKKLLRYDTLEVENGLNMYKAECQITGDCAKENQEDAT